MGEKRNTSRALSWFGFTNSVELGEVGEEFTAKHGTEAEAGPLFPPAVSCLPLAASSKPQGASPWLFCLATLTEVSE